MRKIKIGVLNEAIGFQVVHDPKTLTYQITIPDKKVEEALAEFSDGRITNVYLEIAGIDFKENADEIDC